MKYADIAEALKKQISQGKLSTGAKLPSVRELCSSYQCNKSTAIRAFLALKEEGLVYSVPGSGYFVIGLSPAASQEPDAIDLSGTSLDPASMPTEEFASCCQEALRKYKETLFAYTDPRGLEPLLAAVEKHLRNHQIFAPRESLCITTGSQQALSLLARMPFPNGKLAVAVEQPTYSGMLNSLRLHGITAIGIERGFRGLDFESLERSFRNDNVKFFYTVPRFNNPLGTSYGREEKNRLVALAEKYNVYVVEDDYLGDLESEAKATPIYSCDRTDRVVYIKSFSKIVLPGLRLAAVVLPRLLTRTFAEQKYWSDLNTPLLSQGAMEVFMTSGLFDKHIKNMRDFYRNRMKKLEHFAADTPTSMVRWHIPANGGFYAGLELSGGRGRGRAFIQRLREQHILLSDLDGNFLEGFADDRILRVSVARIAPERMEDGIRAIVREAGICPSPCTPSAPL